MYVLDNCGLTKMEHCNIFVYISGEFEPVMARGGNVK